MVSVHIQYMTALHLVYLLPAHRMENNTPHKLMINYNSASDPDDFIADPNPASIRILMFTAHS
jgi:hypothetical protein